MGADSRTPFTLVVGAGGLLGRAVVRGVVRSGGSFIAPRVKWGNSALADLGDALDRLAAEAMGGAWRVVWCAGAAVTASNGAELEREAEVLEGFLGMLGRRTGGELDSGRGSVFFASSAGGVYAGSSGAPFTESTTPEPLSEYGRGKLRLEGLVRDASATTGLRTVIGRIANLYGPGQNLDKPQGLVSTLCRAHVTGTSVGIYVPLDTLRDYLYVDDCASLVLGALDCAEQCQPGNTTTKILASHRSLSVAALLKETQRVLRRPLRVRLATSPVASMQAIDLRLRSTVWTDLDRRPLVPLPAGIAATASDVERRMLAGRSRD